MFTNNNSLQPSDLNLDFVVMPAKVFRHSGLTDLHNQLYNFWLDQWTRAFATTEPLPGWEHEYEREDIIVGLIDTRRQKVAGCHLYTLFNLESNATQRNAYLKYVHEVSRQILRARGITHLMSMEFLAVEENYRKSKIGFSLGEVLIGLALKVSMLIGFDCVFGTPVKVAKTDSMMEKFGSVVLEPSFIKHGWDVALAYIPSTATNVHREAPIREYIDKLWANHTNYLPESYIVNAVGRVA